MLGLQASQLNISKNILIGWRGIW